MYTNFVLTKPPELKFLSITAEGISCFGLNLAEESIVYQSNGFFDKRMDIRVEAQIKGKLQKTVTQPHSLADICGIVSSLRAISKIVQTIPDETIP